MQGPTELDPPSPTTPCFRTLGRGSGRGGLTFEGEEIGPKVVCAPNRARRVLKLSCLTLGLNRKTQGDILKKLHLRIGHEPPSEYLPGPAPPWIFTFRPRAREESCSPKRALFMFFLEFCRISSPSKVRVEKLIFLFDPLSLPRRVTLGKNNFKRSGNWPSDPATFFTEELP